MDATVVDPRDSQWEILRPSYRVYFWQEDSLPTQLKPDSSGYRSSEVEMVADDVGEVLSWATKAGEGRLYTVYAVVRRHGELGLVRLAGADPTSVR